jgi:hypothetical protein
MRRQPDRGIGLEPYVYWSAVAAPLSTAGRPPHTLERRLFRPPRREVIAAKEMVGLLRPWSDAHVLKIMRRSPHLAGLHQTPPSRRDCFAPGPRQIAGRRCTDDPSNVATLLGTVELSGHLVGGAFAGIYFGLRGPCGNIDPAARAVRVPKGMAWREAAGNPLACHAVSVLRGRALRWCPVGDREGPLRRWPIRSLSWSLPTRRIASPDGH